MSTNDSSERRLGRFLSYVRENPELVIAVVSATVLLVVVFSLISFIEFDYSFSLNLFGTLLGFLLNVLLFGILLVLIRKRDERKSNIRRWLEEIDDYKLWKEAAATYRIVGTVKRLNKYRIININLSSCYLREADLDSMNLKGADLTFADLKGAYLGKASLEGANLENAKLQGAFLNKTDLTAANLKMADLQGALLREANLQEANLRSTDVQGADFMFANLRKAFGYVLEDLGKAKTFYQAKLDAEVEKELQTKYPQLFEKPKDETIVPPDAS